MRLVLIILTFLFIGISALYWHSHYTLHWAVGLQVFQSSSFNILTILTELFRLSGQILFMICSLNVCAVFERLSCDTLTRKLMQIVITFQNGNSFTHWLVSAWIESTIALGTFCWLTALASLFESLQLVSKFTWAIVSNQLDGDYLTHSTHLNSACSCGSLHWSVKKLAVV